MSSRVKWYDIYLLSIQVRLVGSGLAEAVAWSLSQMVAATRDRER